LTIRSIANAPCVDAISSMTLTINKAATASIGVANVTICEGSNYTLGAATVSNNNGLYGQPVVQARLAMMLFCILSIRQVLLILLQVMLH